MSLNIIRMYFSYHDHINQQKLSLFSVLPLFCSSLAC